jgi:hypothetical protein
MKTLSFILKIVIIPSMLYPSILFSQIPNQGFEDWIDKGNYNNPDQWLSLNDITEPTGVYTCTKGSPGNPGASYIKLTSKNVTGMGLMPGIAVSGELNTSTMQALSGFAMTGRPESISGNCKYMAYEGDQGYICVLLTRWNISSSSRDTVSYTYHPLPGMEMSWAEFMIALDYQSDLFPDSCIITLSSSNANGIPTSINSYLYIDNLDFNNIVTSITDGPEQVSIQIYPNPTNSELFIGFPSTYKKADIKILNMNGQVMLRSKNQNITETVSLDVHNLPYGIYLLEIQSELGQFSKLFIRR